LIVEYIIMLSIIAVVVAFLFPGMKGALNEWLLSVEKGIESGGKAPSQEFDPTFLIIMMAVGGLAAIAYFLYQHLEKTPEGTFVLKFNKNETPVKKEKVEAVKEVVSLSKLPEKEVSISDKIKKMVFEKEEIDGELEKKTYEILEYIKVLSSNAKSLDIETYHTLKRITDNELYQLLNKFSRLSKKNKKSQRESVMNSLVSIENELMAIFNSLENQKLHEFTKMAKLIQERYKKKA